MIVKIVKRDCKALLVTSLTLRYSKCLDLYLYTSSSLPLKWMGTWGSVLSSPTARCILVNIRLKSCFFSG